MHVCHTKVLSSPAKCNCTDQSSSFWKFNLSKSLSSCWTPQVHNRLKTILACCNNCSVKSYCQCSYVISMGIQCWVIYEINILKYTLFSSWQLSFSSSKVNLTSGLGRKIVYNSQSSSHINRLLLGIIVQILSSTLSSETVNKVNCIWKVWHCLVDRWVIRWFYYCSFPRFHCSKLISMSYIIYLKEIF